MPRFHAAFFPPLLQEMGNSPELGHRAIWRTAEATAADCLTCFTNQSSQFLLALVALLHSRAFSTHKALLPCTLLCALTAALSCLLPHSRARRAPALSRAFSTHKAVLPCTLFCALTAALTCQPHAQSSLALYALLRPQLHFTCPLHAQALLPCALPCSCLLTLVLVHVPATTAISRAPPLPPSTASSCSVTRLARSSPI